VHYEAPAVPDIAKTASGKIVVRVTLDQAGLVAEARAMEVKLDPKTVAGLDTAAAKREMMAALADSAVTSVKAWRYDPPAEAPLAFNISIQFGESSKSAPGVSEEKALHVGGAIKPPVKIQDVPPVYPPDALAAGIKGVVILEARIDADGNVENARAIKSIPELDQAAIDAVKQWKFVPTLMNGVPTPIIMTVTINFTPE
jgi:protein TonB